MRVPNGPSVYHMGPDLKRHGNVRRTGRGGQTRGIGKQRFGRAHLD